MKKFFEEILQRYNRMIPLPAIIVFEEGGDGYEK